MKFESFGPVNIDKARELIDEKLAELKEYGIDVQLGNITYSESSISSKLDFRIEDSKIICDETHHSSLEYVQNPMFKIQ